MRPEIRVIGGHEFWSVGPLELRRTPDGDLEEYTHELEEGIRPNRHAAGPFCVMRLSAAPSAPGVYAIFVDAEVRYIGECQDLAARFGSSGYGQIQPRNCHHDGQSTNCKLNSRVLAAARRGEVARVWFCHTPDHKTLEQELLAKLDTPWNGRDSAGTNAPRRRGHRSNPGSRPASAKPRHGTFKEEFRRALMEMLAQAAAEGAEALEVRAGDLHRKHGGYPGPNHRMPSCCSAMRSLMDSDDRFVYQPPRGNGASLTIEYRLPRRDGGAPTFG